MIEGLDHNYFFEEGFNTSLMESHGLEYLAHLGRRRLPTSAANKQPWRIAKSQNSYDFWITVQTSSNNGIRV